MKSNKNTIWFWLFVAPVLIALFFVIVVPFIYGIYYSLTDWNGIDKINFVGFKNYLEVFTNAGFRYSFIFTTVYSIFAVIIINAVGLSLALLVTQKLKVEKFLRTIFFVPNLIGGLILGFIWQFVFVKIFPYIGIDGWLTTRTSSFFAILIVSVWQMGGYIMTIYVAYIQSIPSELTEAATVDGANVWQRFRNVTFPLIAPGFTVTMFLTLSNSFKMYDLNLSLTNGGPGNQTKMLAMNIVTTAYGENRMAFAQAEAVVFFIIVASISLVQAYYNKKREVEM